jgi:hypothetical protein
MNIVEPRTHRGWPALKLPGGRDQIVGRACIKETQNVENGVTDSAFAVHIAGPFETYRRSAGSPFAPASPSPVDNADRWMRGPGRFCGPQIGQRGPNQDNCLWMHADEDN